RIRHSSRNGTGGSRQREPGRLSEAVWQNKANGEKPMISVERAQPAVAVSPSDTALRLRRESSGRRGFGRTKPNGKTE
ncbi:MAG TPA: hypothetical protein VFU97_05060, partial [Xanthobacteraceae bacterium]|nr:hypothetical protein [Xanthobacteraceae bacterium]